MRHAKYLERGLYPAGGTEMQQATSMAGTEEQEVRRFFQDLLDAWNRGDAAAYAVCSPRTPTTSGSTE
jgi:hypothetical protein